MGLFRKPVSIAGVLLAVAATVATIAYLRMPPARPRPRAAPLDAAEQARLVSALAPPRRARPVVAVVGDNAGSETTDYVIPFSVLRESGVADVHALATGPGPLALYPALTIEPHSTTSEFDARFPEGADYVVVPALQHPEAPLVVAWIRGQRAKGATVVGICAGVMTLAAAGLVDGRAATTHWYYLDDLRERHPTMRWARDRRYVADRGVVTTTGITASIPVSLALVEAIAGRERAAAVAESLGVASWDASHDSDAFGLDRRGLATVVRNRGAFWRHETLALPVEPGVDELAVALTADPYSRTYRSRAVTVARAGGPVLTRRGLRLLPDRVGSTADLPPVAPAHPARALDTALVAIANRYGASTADFVAMQMEYPGRWERR
ncbi:MAG TPA: DJ-1/PfpI family protein [Vicinamibacteria bacterium]|nr:DJ-1/PfpI family protein [Vicinamibacteria bacterium]